MKTVITLLHAIIAKLDELVCLFKDGPIPVVSVSDSPASNVSTINFDTHPLSQQSGEQVFFEQTPGALDSPFYTLSGHMQPDEFLQFSLDQGDFKGAGGIEPTRGVNQPRPQRMDEGGTKEFKIVAGVIVDGPDELMTVIAECRAIESQKPRGFILQYIYGNVWMLTGTVFRVFHNGKWEKPKRYGIHHKALFDSKTTQVYANRADANLALYALMLNGYTQANALVERLAEPEYNYVFEVPGVMLRQSAGSTKWEEFYLDDQSWRLE